MNILILLLLSGCVSYNAVNYENQLNPFVGVSSQQLIRSWGTPANVQPVSANEEIYTYIDVTNAPNGGDTDPYSDEVYYPAIATSSYGISQPDNNYFCKTNFIIKNDIVVNYNYNGDDCVSKN